SLSTFFRSLVVYLPASPPALPSFPTRRSSDLNLILKAGQIYHAYVRHVVQHIVIVYIAVVHRIEAFLHTLRTDVDPSGQADHFRSEEHTSELQSRFDLVCRLLPEKKKKPEGPARKTRTQLYRQPIPKKPESRGKTVRSSPVWQQSGHDNGQPTPWRMHRCGPCNET